jgi:hypothetical protein
MTREQVRKDDTVIVTGSTGRKVDTKRHTVVRVGPVWITTVRIEDVGKPWATEYRFRRDTQRDPRDVGYGSQFYTLAQWAEQERKAAVCEFLHSQGIVVESGSPWSTRLEELAGLISRGEFGK